MKVLILTDERYAALTEILTARETNELLGSANVVPKLPEAERLHTLARSGSEPEAFAQVRERMEAVGFASDRVREQLHGLIFDGYKVGIPQRDLARWSGYHPRRIHQIINPELAQDAKKRAKPKRKPKTKPTSKG